MKKMLLAASGLLALLMVLSGTVFVQAAAPTAAIGTASGEPAMNADKDFGYYIWFDGNRYHLRTTDRGNGPSPSEYTGVITARHDEQPSPITDADAVRLENGDWAVASGNRLAFHFTTYNAVDGVNFTAKDATNLTFRLYRKGEDGTMHLISADHIFLGAGQVSPPGNPFTLVV